MQIKLQNCFQQHEIVGLASAVTAKAIGLGFVFTGIYHLLLRLLSESALH